MKVAEFINRCDILGGLSCGFNNGLSAKNIVMVEEADNELFDAVYYAEEAWNRYKKAEDRYYALVETGEY